ncbi:MAG: zinc ribbon domain-containing protein [Chloroflexota bacterium]
MKCPTCGAVNDPANRFCDQCGTRLQGSDAPAPTPAVVAEQPTAAALQCPSCQATVLPGEAFCDECGASLAGLSVDVANANAPTIYAPPSSQATADTEGKPTCQICGFQYVPGDQFCEQCGAVLPTGIPDEVPAMTVSNNHEPEAPMFGLPSSGRAENASSQEQSVPVETPVSTGSDDQQTSEAAPSVAPDNQQTSEAVPSVAPDDQTTPSVVPEIVSQSEVPVVAEAPAVEEPPTAAVEPNVSSVSSDEEIAIPVADTTPPVATPTQAAQPSADDQAAYEAERTRLQEEIARQEQLVAQFEQMQATFGAAAPPAVSQGLDEARTALTRLQTELDSLQPPVPTVDPAEIARLEEEIARQEQLVAQFEQMQSTFGAAAPPAVSQGLDEARTALTRLQTELVALGGSSSSPVVASTPEPEAAPSSTLMEVEPSLDTPVESSVVPVANAHQPAGGDVPVEPVAQSPVTPEPVASSTPPIAPPPVQTMATPRLIVESSGQELAFPAGKNEIVIGREDPISGIFPEVDLTNHGGESGGVSRQHARMSFAYGQWTVTDLDSTNYTRVDGVKIDPNVPVPVQDGARLQFGRIVFNFKS